MKHQTEYSVKYDGGKEDHFSDYMEALSFYNSLETVDKAIWSHNPTELIECKAYEVDSNDDINDLPFN